MSAQLDFAMSKVERRSIPRRGCRFAPYHFRLDGPTAIRFSAGRTSAYLLWLYLDSYHGDLPEETYVVFNNTGKERTETLMFAHEVETRWRVRVRWIERAPGPHARGTPSVTRFREVNFATAATQGEPFDAVVNERRYLPNPITRFCTEELKIRPTKHFMRSHGFARWTSVLGLRADEPRRVANVHNPERQQSWEDIETPLASAGATVADVMAFWHAQRGGVDLDAWLALPPAERPGWDLALLPHEGNCDLCFLKGIEKRQRIIDATPERADWWITAEERIGRLTLSAGARFRKDGPTYADLKARAERGRRCLPVVAGGDPTDLGDCLCTD